MEQPISTSSTRGLRQRSAGEPQQKHYPLQQFKASSKPPSSPQHTNKGVYPCISPPLTDTAEEDRNRRRRDAVNAAVNAARNSINSNLQSAQSRGNTPASKFCSTNNCKLSKEETRGSSPCPSIVLASLGMLYLFPTSMLLMAGAYLAATSPSIARNHAYQQDKHVRTKKANCVLNSIICLNPFQSDGISSCLRHAKKHGFPDDFCTIAKDFACLSAPVVILAWFVGLKICNAVSVIIITTTALSLHNRNYPGERPTTSKLVSAGIIGLLLLGARHVIVGAFAFKMLQSMFNWPQNIKGHRVKKFGWRSNRPCKAALHHPEQVPDAAMDSPRQAQWTKETWADGSHYNGTMLHGKRHGQGSYSWADGSNYTGEWKEGKIHGTGVFHFANGDCFEGEYVQDRKHGYGKYTWAETGTSFEGMWKNDKMMPI